LRFAVFCVEGDTLSTLTAQPSIQTRAAQRRTGAHPDRYFFTITAFLMVLAVFCGFARSYYLAGIFRAPLPSPILHVHGAAFTLWMILLIAQTSLVAVRRTDLHRQLGLAGFVLAAAMIVIGVLAGTDSLFRHAGALDRFGRDPKMFYIVPLSDMVLFTIFVFCAFRARFTPPAHKRLLYIASTVLLVAPIARLPFAFSARNVPVDGLLSEIFLVALIGYDLWSTRRIHRVTIWAGTLLVLVQLTRIPIGKTGEWHAFADWVILHFR
jgi:hypothetical protein